MSDLNLQPGCELRNEHLTGGCSTFPPDRVRLMSWLGPYSIMISDGPDPLSQALIHDASAAYVGRAYEHIRQVRRLGCRLVSPEVNSSHLKNNPIVAFLKRTSTSFPAYKRAGATALGVFK